MRILGFIGAIIVMAALSAGSAVLLVTQAGVRGDWFLLSGVASSMLWLTPVLLMSMLAFWDVKRSAGAGRAYRRMMMLTVVVQVVAAVLLSVYAVLSRTPWWVVVVLVGAAIALTAVAVKLGPALRRTEGPSTLRAEGAVYRRADLRHDVRRIVVAGVGGLVVGALGFGALYLALDDGEESPGWVLVGAALFCAIMAAGAAASFIVLRLSRQQRDLLDGDLERARTIGKVVIRGKKIVLSAEDEAIAPRYAAISAVSQTYTLVQLVCLFGGLGGMQVARLIDDPTDALTLAIMGLYVVGTVMIAPISVIQLRRTRAYARDHGEPIIEPRDPAAASLG